MTSIEQAEKLRTEAIELLLQERGAIDEKLKQLSYGHEPKKIRACSKCGSPDHNARSCKATPSETTL